LIEPAHDLADAFEIPVLFGGVGALPKIAGHLFEPHLRIGEPLTDERLDHGIPKDRPVRLPVGHLGRDHVDAEVIEGFEAVLLGKRGSANERQRHLGPPGGAIVAVRRGRRMRRVRRGSVGFLPLVLAGLLRF